MALGKDVAVQTWFSLSCSLLRKLVNIKLSSFHIEHQAKQFFIFVDLKKAYDSVSREALCLALKKLGVPDTLIDIIRSFHDNMNASIRVDGELLEEIEVNNGLRQRCSMAPTLFNLYAYVVGE